MPRSLHRGSRISRVRDISVCLIVGFLGSVARNQRFCYSAIPLVTDRMRFALKGVANGKGSMFGKGQSVRGCNWRANVATSVTGHLGVVFKPEQESFFELTTKGYEK